MLAAAPVGNVNPISELLASIFNAVIGKTGTYVCVAVPCATTNCIYSLPK